MNGCISSALELASRTFDGEYDLAMAVIAKIEARGQRGEFAVQRFMFQSCLATQPLLLPQPTV